MYYFNKNEVDHVNNNHPLKIIHLLNKKLIFFGKPLKSKVPEEILHKLNIWIDNETLEFVDRVKNSGLIDNRLPNAF